MSTCYHCGAEKLEPSPCSNSAGSETLEQLRHALRQARDNGANLYGKLKATERSEKRYRDANDSLKAEVNKLRAEVKRLSDLGADYSPRSHDGAGATGLGPDVADPVKRAVDR